MMAAGKALTNLGNQLTAIAGPGGPVTKYNQASQSIGKQMVLLAGQVKTLGRFALTTATTFAAGVREVAKQYENLYYISLRTGASIENLTNLQFSFKQIGLAGDAATEALVAFQRTLRDNPGKQALVNALIRPEDLAAVKKSFGEGLKGISLEFEAFIHYINTLPPWLRTQYGAMVGLSGDMLDLLSKTEPVRAEAYKAHAAALDRIGLDQTKFGEQSAVFIRHLNTLWTNVTLIFDKAAQESLPFLDKMALGADRLIVKLQEFDKLHPFAATIEGLAVATTGVLALDAALGKVTAGALGFGKVSAAAFGILRFVSPWAAGAYAFRPYETNKGEDEALRARGQTPLTGPGEMAPKTWGGVWQGLKGLLPHFQHGGIVGANLHQGEAVLPSGLTSLLMRAANRGGELVVLESILEGLRAWWAGSSAYRPVVIPRSDLVFGDQSGAGPEQGPRMHGDPLGLGGRARTGSGGAVGRLSPAAGKGTPGAASFVRYLIEMGVDRAHAEGMVANALAESSFNPGALGKAGERGLFQWDRSRWAALQSSLGEQQLNPFAQLAYAVAEMKKRDPGWFGTPMSAERATGSFEHGFERPAHETGRLSYLRQVQESSKNVVINQTNTVHVQHGDPLGGEQVGRHYIGAHRRMSEDLVRSFRVALG